MSSSPQYLFGYDREGRLRFDSERASVRFVERLEESRNFCGWCFVPLCRCSPRLPDLPVCTCSTYDTRTELTEGVPPDEVDKTGGVVNVSREVLEICSCGWIDVAPDETRSRETTHAHLENILTLLAENGADVNQHAARGVVNDAFDNRRSGQFAQVVGEAIYDALEE